VTPERMQDLPALIFILPSFMTHENSHQVTAVVEQLSATYFVIMRERLDLLTCSTMALGWARSYMFNEDLLD